MQEKKEIGRNERLSAPYASFHWLLKREHLRSVGFLGSKHRADSHAPREVPPPSLRPRKSLFQEGTSRIYTPFAFS
jgi:hypothetical protein